MFTMCLACCVTAVKIELAFRYAIGRAQLIGRARLPHGASEENLTDANRDGLYVFPQGKKIDDYRER